MNQAPFIPYGRHTIEQDDLDAVLNVLRSSHLTTGPKVAEFEQAVATYVGAKEGVAFSSGTAALHGAMTVCGVGTNDEVLVPTLSFLASANAVLYAGARPVFVDCIPGGFNLDLSDAEKKITPRTKAIVAVHFAGQPVDGKALDALAEKYHLKIIEDAAHAFGAESQGRRVGSSPHSLTVFSFHPVKHITTAEGGMVMTADATLAARLRRFRHHGIGVDVVARDAQKQWFYDMSDLGFNYRLCDLQCALGVSQLKKADRFLKSREALAAAYDQAFSSIDGLLAPPRAIFPDRHSWHLYCIRLDPQKTSRTRDELFSKLRHAGVGVQVHYRPIHLHSYYASLGYAVGDCPVAEETFKTMLSLPLFPGLTPPMQDRVISAVRTLIEEGICP